MYLLYYTDSIARWNVFTLVLTLYYTRRSLLPCGIVVADGVRGSKVELFYTLPSLRQYSLAATQFPRGLCPRATIFPRELCRRNTILCYIGLPVLQLEMHVEPYVYIHVACNFFYFSIYLYIYCVFQEKYSHTILRPKTQLATTDMMVYHARISGHSSVLKCNSKIHAQHKRIL